MCDEVRHQKQSCAKVLSQPPVKEATCLVDKSEHCHAHSDSDGEPTKGSYHAVTQSSLFEIGLVPANEERLRVHVSLQGNGMGRE